MAYRIFSKNSFAVESDASIAAMKSYLKELGEVVEKADDDIVIYYFTHDIHNDERQFSCYEMYKSDAAFFNHQASARYTEIIRQLAPLIKKGSFTTVVWCQEGKISERVENTFRGICDNFYWGESVGGFIRCVR